MVKHHFLFDPIETNQSPFPNFIPRPIHRAPSSTPAGVDGSVWRYPTPGRGPGANRVETLKGFFVYPDDVVGETSR